MPLTPSGTISMSNINTALGRSSTASISMNDSQVRFLANQDSGSVTMNNMRNKWNFNGNIAVGYTASKTSDLVGFSTGVMGSITGGPLWNSAPILAFYTEIEPLGGGITRYDSVISTSSGSGPFVNVPMRVKVGSNPAITISYVSSTQYFTGYVDSPTAAMMFFADVGNTRTWQFSQT